jgi:hypothetical protein
VARIRSLDVGTQNVRPHASEVDCFYQVVEGPQHERLLHLSTFGSDTRKSDPKSSQSIQVDRELAGQLIEVLRRVFPGL